MAGVAFRKPSNAKLEPCSDTNKTMSRPTDQNRVHDMIGNMYMSGGTSLRIHVKPTVDLYKFPYKVRTLLIC